MRSRPPRLNEHAPDIVKEAGLEQMSDGIALAVAHSVATLCLNREEKRNAVTYDMWVALGEHCRALGGRSDVRVLVVRGRAPISVPGRT